MNLKNFTWQHRILALLAGITIGVLILASPIVKVAVIILWALYLFTSETFPVDMTAILIMIVLMVTGLVSPEQGVSGFSNVATITVLSMFILSAAIEKTGVIQKLGNSVFGFLGNSEVLQILVIAVLIAPLSGFINNTAAVAIFLPMILKLAKKSKTPATKLLIPLSFLSMLGGTLTLLGTSTNILANAVLKENSIPTFSVFEFTHIGAIVLVIGIVYFLIIGRFLLPERKAEEDPGIKSADTFLSELVLEKHSPFIGKTMETIRFAEKFEVEPVKIIRGGKSFVQDVNTTELAKGDVIVFFAEEQRVMDLDSRKNEKLVLDFDVNHRRMSGETKIIKVLLRKIPVSTQVKSFFKGKLFSKKRTLEDMDFWKRYNAAIIGVHREAKDIVGQRITSLGMETGEVFLVKVTKSNLHLLQKSENLMLLEEVEQEYDATKTWLTVSILVGVVALAAFGILPIMLAALCGVFCVFLTRCLHPKELYASVHWNVIFLLAGVIPLGIAMQESGAAEMIANSIVGISGMLPLIVIMGIFYLVTTVMTEIISNNAAIVLLLPIAISVAHQLGADPKAFALIIMFAASTSFLSPVGYQTNTMVYGAGNYKFSDFIKVGAPLNMILLVVTTVLIYYFMIPH